MATNTLVTTSMITKFGLKRFMNSLVMANRIDRQLDEKKIFSSSAGQAGKPGVSVEVRRPVYFIAKDGAALDTNDIVEGTVTVTLDQRKQVSYEVTSEQLGLELEELGERLITPAMDELAQEVETVIASRYSDIANFVGTPGTPPASFIDIGNANVKLSELGVPKANRFGFWNSRSTLTLANGLKSVFVQDISRPAIERASFGQYTSFDNYECQSIASHTVGALGGSPVINGADQDVTYLASKDTDSQTLNVDGWDNSVSDILNKGDVFNIAGVFAVNRRTRQSTGALKDFVVLANADSNGSGETALLIAPAIIADTTSPYQNVTAAPIDGAVVTVLTGEAGQTYAQNLTWHKNALTLAFGPIDVPRDGATGYRQNYKGISLRVVRQYSATTDETTMRFDILFAVVVQNRGFACRVSA